MSGICGLMYNRSGAPVNREQLWSLAGGLEDRGPDSIGLYTDGNLGLAVRRLALNDRLGYDQPMANEDGTIVVVCSGEIYNGLQLRKTLEGSGHSFATPSDLEVIVHGYEEWGDEVVDRLNGMFAFSLWDGRRRRLLLARDSMGQRSLYWAYSGQGLAWCSALKPLLRIPWIDAKLSPVALHHYLTLQYVPDPLSLVDGIHKLPASHLLVMEHEQEPKIIRWWKLRFVPKVFGRPEEHFREAGRTFDSVLRRHLPQDTTAGVLLGDNIESSLIAISAAQLTNQPIKTFSLAYPGDYSPHPLWARRVAKAAGSDHIEVPFVPPDLGALADEVIDSLSDPIADPRSISLFELTKHARQHVKVLLTAEGAEETMASYRRYRHDLVANIFSFFPRILTRRLLPTFSALVPDFAWLPQERNPFLAAKRVVQALEVGPRASMLRWSSYFSHNQKLELYRPELNQTLTHLHTTELLQRTFESAEADGYIDRSLYTDQRTYLTASILPRTEGLTAVQAIEARAPFLDKQWVEWTAHLPLDCKHSLVRSHVLLRRGFAKRLPIALTKGRVHGLEVPIAYWLRKDLAEWSRAKLVDGRHLDPWFRRSSVERLWNAHYKGRADHGFRLWTLLVLARWLETTGVRQA